VWLQTPFYVIIILAGSRHCPGAVRGGPRRRRSAWLIFRNVTLPGSARATGRDRDRSIDAFRVFDTVWTITRASRSADRGLHATLQGGLRRPELDRGAAALHGRVIMCVGHRALTGASAASRRCNGERPTGAGGALEKDEKSSSSPRLGSVCSACSFPGLWLTLTPPPESRCLRHEGATSAGPISRRLGARRSRSRFSTSAILAGGDVLLVR
jgi:hypothetical protein